MALTGEAIGREIEAGRIHFEPFDPARLNPNSVDIRLGASLTEIDADGAVREHALTEAGFMLAPGGLYLADSLERFGSAHYAPIVHGKSNIARAGLFVHINGDMVDVGAVGPYQFQLAPLLPIRVFPGMAIAQVTFWPVKA